MLFRSIILQAKPSSKAMINLLGKSTDSTLAQ